MLSLFQVSSGSSHVTLSNQAASVCYWGAWCTSLSENTTNLLNARDTYCAGPNMVCVHCFAIIIIITIIIIIIIIM